VLRADSLAELLGGRLEAAPGARLEISDLVSDSRRVTSGAAFVAPAVSPDLVQIGQAQYADTTADTLQRGHDTFLASCGRGGFCHKLPTPKSRTPQQWPVILDRMAKKAGLDDAQKQDILRFVLAVRELPRSSLSLVSTR